MKKLVLLLVCMFTMHTMVMADNDKPIQVNQLPAKAQTFLNTYFKDHKVALAKQETELFYKSYDVVFTNGEKVEFDLFDFFHLKLYKNIIKIRNINRNINRRSWK